MTQQEEFFSPSHNRLLNVAWWAKNIAWIVLGVYSLWVGIQVIQLIFAKDNGNFFGPTSQSLSTMLRDNPLDLFRRAVAMSTTFLQGIVYFLVLKAISLGLSMIVETDINYREQGDLQDGQ